MAHSLITPKAAPKQSISGFEWPIINIFFDWSISCFNAWPTILDFPLFLFSTVCNVPPKYSIFLLRLTTAWSPPLPKAKSKAASAYSSVSAGFFPPAPTPIFEGPRWYDRLDWSFSQVSVSGRSGRRKERNHRPGGRKTAIISVSAGSMVCRLRKAANES